MHAPRVDPVPGSTTRTEGSGLRIFLLGRFQVERAAKVLPDSVWQRPKAKMLVKLLAVEPSHRLHREQIIDILWPDLEPESAVNSFSKSLHLARHALEPERGRGSASTYLCLEGDVLALSSEQIWIDADDFATMGEAAIGRADASAIATALALYAGALLPDDRYEDWALSRRETLEGLHLRLLLTLARLRRESGDFADAIVRLQAAIQCDPLNESVHRDLMALHALTGKRHDALRQYQTCAQTLEQEVGAEPEPETRSLYQDILAGRFAGKLVADTRSSDGTTHARTAGTPLPPALRTPAPTPLVGRDPALLFLRNELMLARAGNPALVLIGGEAGVGKSRLVSELAREAQREGDLVIWGASYEQEGLLPYGPFVEALDGYLSTLPEDQRRSISTRYPALSRLLASLASVGGADTPASDASNRTQLFSGVVRLLIDLTGLGRASQPAVSTAWAHSADRSRALVIVLEDMHAADTESLQLLHHVARALTTIAAPLLMVGSYRDDDVQAGSPCQHLIAAATRQRLCRLLDLRRLARADCDYLVTWLLPDGAVDQAVLAHLYVQSLGNPLFLHELVRAMRERGDLALTDGHWHIRTDSTVSVPGQVRDLMEKRIHRLDEDTRRALGLAAVTGMESSLSELRAAAMQAFGGSFSEDALLNALDRAIEARVIEERASRLGVSYAFPHPLLRATLYERLSQSRRAQLHKSVASAMEQQRPDEVQALAFHYSQSEDHAKAAQYLERAADRARIVYANEAAEVLYNQLIERLDSLRRPLESAAAREKLGAVLLTMARYDDALAALTEAAHAYHTAGDLESVGRVTAQVGRVHAQRGTVDDGIRSIQPLVEALATVGPSAALAALYASQASLLRLQQRYGEQLVAAEKGVEAARLVGDDHIVVEADLWRGHALLALGRADEGARVLESVTLLAESLGDLTSLSRALNGLATVHSDRGEFEQERMYLQRALELAERLNDPSRIAFMTFRRGENALLTGDWESARADLRRSVSMSRKPGCAWVLPYALCALGASALFAGDRDGAARHLNECLALTETVHNLPVLVQTQMLLAERDLITGCFDAARARLDPLLDHGDLQDVHVTYLLPMAAWAALEAGDTGRADALSEQAVTRGQRAGNRYALVTALRVRGIVMARQERWEEALHGLESALELARAMRYPYAEARVLEAYAAVHEGRGEAEARRERLEQAGAILRRLRAGEETVSST